MEVVLPVMAPSTAPCSPRTAAIAGGDHHLPGYCYFFSSAPTSPSRASYAGDASPGDRDGDGATTFDFTLGFRGQLQEATPILAAADELFEGGRIRPLNTPHYPSVIRMVDDTSSSSYSSSLFPRSPRRSAAAGGARGREVDHRQAADAASERGRSAATASAASSRSRRATRSLSPFRGGCVGGDGEESSPSSPPSPRTSMMRGCGSGSKKWRLKDLFLFRSASEGRAAGSKDPLFKYTMLSSNSSSSFSQSQPHHQKVKTGGDGSASMRKGRGSTASASDMPYAVNRAAAEDMRRRTTTPLPFHRNSLFGYLRSNPAIHSISRKLGNHSSSSSSNRGSRPAA